MINPILQHFLFAPLKNEFPAFFSFPSGISKTLNAPSYYDHLTFPQPKAAHVKLLQAGCYYYLLNFQLLASLSFHCSCSPAIFNLYLLAHGWSAGLG